MTNARGLPRSLLLKSALPATLATLLVPLFVSCTNVFAPPAAAAGSTNDLGALTDPATLIAMGNVAIDQGDYARSQACFERAILLNPRLSLARLGAVRSVMLRDDPLSFAALSTLMTGLGGGNLSGLGTFVGGLNASALYASGGAPTRVQSYLRDTNGYSWWAGQCDGVVPTNGLTALINLLFANVLELPAVMFDLRRDYVYNNTNDINTSGDLLLWTGGAVGINPTFYSLTNSFASVASNLSSLTNPTSLAGLTNATNVVNLAYLSNAAIASSPFAGAVPVLLSADDTLKAVHVSLMALLAGVKTVDLAGRLALLDQINARIATIPGAAAVTNMLGTVLSVSSLLGAMNTDANASNVMGGGAFNTVHLLLDGSNAFNPAAGLSSFAPWTWVPLSNAAVKPSTNSLQGQLKITWTNFGLP
ncbi:MAG: tetratricopeptide repeat protein [Spirochaetes bacterium]|nr:tetratricopeptide repeat protein [Spirochaetota bacterium]